MYLDNLSGAGNYYSPFLSGQAHAARTKYGDDGAVASTNSPTAASSSEDPVSLSSAAQALQAPTASSGAQSGTLSPDFTQEQQLLTTLADKSLEALGIISPSQESSTQINFNSLSYDVSSSASASLDQQGQQIDAQAGESQSATLEGEGQIVTADGTTYDFQIELQVGGSEQASAASALGANSAAGAAPNTPAPTASDANTSPSASSTSNSSASGSSTPQSLPSNSLAQLLNAMEQSFSSQSAGGASNDFLSSNSDAPSTASSGSQAIQSASATPTINWDAIEKQTASLIDLLNSMTASIQSSAGSGSSPTNSANSNAKSASALTAAS